MKLIITLLLICSSALSRYKVIASIVSLKSVDDENEEQGFLRRRRRHESLLGKMSKKSKSIDSHKKEDWSDFHHIPIDEDANVKHATRRDEVKLFEGDIIPEYDSIVENYGEDVAKTLVEEGIMESQQQDEYSGAEVEPPDQDHDIQIEERFKAARNINISRRWPMRVGDVVQVPYSISGEYSLSDVVQIRNALKELGDRSKVVNFVERTDVADHIQVIKDEGCYSYVGKSHGVQKLSLGEGCVHKGIIQHEFMHALGIYHEQSRPDRDKYVVINTQNIQDEATFNFLKLDITTTLGNTYDYGSVMHYGRNDFSKNGRDTITPLENGVTIGQRDEASNLDILDIRLLYQCVSGSRRRSEYNSNRCTADCKCWENEEGCNGKDDACQGSLICVSNHCVIPPPTAPTPIPPSITPLVPTATCGNGVCEVHGGEGCASCEDCSFPRNCNSISTHFSGPKYLDDSVNGIMFDVKVGEIDLFFYAIDMFIKADTMTQVYLKNGSYVASVEDDWILVFSRFITEPQVGMTELLFDSKFYAPAGSTVGFFIDFEVKGSFVFSINNAASNTDMTVQTGELLPRGFLGEYDFSGNIYYDRAPPTQASCTEDSDGLIFGRVFPGNMLDGTCAKLAKYPQYIDLVCSLDPKIEALRHSPSNLCPQTCKSSLYELEIPSALFLGLIERKGTPIVYEKSCAWLSLQKEKVIQVACNLDLSLWDKYAASSACCKTCA